MAQAPDFREVVYRLLLRPGVAPATLPLRLAEGTKALTIETAVTHLDARGHVWRILHVYGPEAEIRMARGAFDAYVAPFLVEKRIMGEGRRKLVLWYKYRAKLGAQGVSATALAFRVLGPETIITDVARAGQLTVKILAKHAANVRGFVRRVKEETERDYEFRLLYAGPLRPVDSTSLSAEEDRVVRMARERGYFGVPRGTGVRELARELGLSASAVSYRLRRVEEKLVDAYLGGA